VTIPKATDKKPSLITPEELNTIIEQGNNEALVKHAERLGKVLAFNRLTTSQIRGIVGAIRRIERAWRSPDQAEQRKAQRELALLQPRLAYLAGRERNQGPLNSLKEVLTGALVLIGNDPARLRNFVDFFEAILAYHKAFGGREQ